MDVIEESNRKRIIELNLPTIKFQFAGTFTEFIETFIALMFLLFLSEWLIGKLLCNSKCWFSRFDNCAAKNRVISLYNIVTNG